MGNVLKWLARTDLSRLLWKDQVLRRKDRLRLNSIWLPGPARDRSAGARGGEPENGTGRYYRSRSVW